MDPQQEIFTALLVALRKEYGDIVFDGALPTKDTPYPFIYLGDSQQLDTATKSSIYGDVVQTIHVYHNNVRQRGNISAILLKIKEIARSIEHTKNYGWMMPAGSVNQMIMPDDTTNQPLLHGILQLTFRFS